MLSVALNDHMRHDIVLRPSKSWLGWTPSRTYFIDTQTLDNTNKYDVGVKTNLTYKVIKFIQKRNIVVHC